jgi:Ca-activated chloride channel family protein
MAVALILSLLPIGGTTGNARAAIPGGELRMLDDTGQPVGACPLEHTEVEAHITGFVSRVRVRQTFSNPRPQKIEAVYVFPLPQDAAVDAMVMTVGDRRIVGRIKPRQEARTIYEAARRAGHVASLLDQERPNIFTQSVANIEPGARVVIEISYVETLTFADGFFEFVFPMVVGPRYMPGTPTGTTGTGWSPDTSQVPDASRISPPVAPPDTRAGHDISLVVHLDAGMTIRDLRSTLHEVNIVRHGPQRATVTLRNKAELPNRDFILRYRTSTDAIGDAFLLHTDERGTFFTLIVQPPRRVLPEQAVPKELLFVIDRSGSMRGFPIDKAKETMRLLITRMNPHDTFNLLSFAGGTGRCFPRPVPNTPANRARALRYLQDLYGSGGTEMMSAIREALGGTPDPDRVRIVAFMTDGYIGNDDAIIDAVRQHAGTTRVFAFGIGNSVNRFLLDGMAHAGRGAVEYVTLQSQGKEAAQRFFKRVQAPVLTDITLDWGGLPVTEVYPRQVPDLFSHTPIMVHGRLSELTSGTVVLRGTTGSGPFERRIAIRSTEPASGHEALASLWARAKVTALMMQDHTAVHRGSMPAAGREAITNLGVRYGLLTPFTSFVAVEEMTVTAGGQPVTVAVPVEMPAGVSHEGVFGSRRRSARNAPAMLRRSPYAMKSSGGLAPARPSVRGYGMNALQAAPQAPRHEMAADATARRAPRPAPQAKLAEALRGLATKVHTQGKDGTLTVGTLRVIDYKVDIMIYLRDTSPKTLEALRRLGFVQSGESKAIRLLIGSLDVRQLDQLAELASVMRVTPVAV